MLDVETKKIILKIASTVKQLAIDGVEKAHSGHPGLPLGCAELGAYLFARTLRHNPKNPHFLNRDRLVLSAGHGAIWLYSLLHLSGYKLSLEDLKRFRQFGSKTPGHPEYAPEEGIEATTGPLGQGSGNGVGMALSLKILNEKFKGLFDAKVYVLVSDGDIMEGVCSEASSLAGHLQLNNLIFIYDSNRVTLDGPLSESCSEDTLKRYKAYGWEVHELDGYDLDAMEALFTSLTHQKPTFIKVNTIIGKGSPHKEGSHKAHGTPLGEEEAKLTKEALGLSEEPFYIPKSVLQFFEGKVKEQEEVERAWHESVRLAKIENPPLFEEFEKMQERWLPEDLEEILWQIEIKSPLATRESSNVLIQEIAKRLPQLIGGSADLSSSDKTLIKEAPIISPGRFEGRNIKFGVREFAMGTIATGLALTGMWTPFVGTFLTFSDYMRNAIRLAALSKLQVIYLFSHDSIFLGEDGPTHQPIEHYAALRAIPHLQMIRPCDANEMRMAWLAALKYREGPSALLLSRQPLPTLSETKLSFQEGLGKGGYLLRKESEPDFILIATGSEVALALDVADRLGQIGKRVRVLSMPSFKLFDKQSTAYKQELLQGGKRVSIEAGVEFGWHKYIGEEGIAISLDTFGASAPLDQLKEPFGFTVDRILERILI